MIRQEELEKKFTEAEKMLQDMYQLEIKIEEMNSEIKKEMTTY